MADREEGVCPQPRGSTVRTLCKRQWSTQTQSAGSWVRAKEVGGEASRLPSSRSTIATTPISPTRIGTWIATVNSGSYRNKIWFTANSNLVDLSLTLFSDSFGFQEVLHCARFRLDYLGFWSKIFLTCKCLVKYGLIWKYGLYLDERLTFQLDMKCPPRSFKISFSRFFFLFEGCKMKIIP